MTTAGLKRNAEPTNKNKPSPKKKRVKMTPEKIRKAAELIAQGKNYGETGQEIGESRQLVRYTFQKDELNQLIKKAQSELLNTSLLVAVKNQNDKIKIGANIVNKIDNGEKLTDGATKLIELAQQCENRLLESVGIHPSHTQSITLNQILVDNRSELSPAIENMLLEHMKNISGADVIDVEAIEPVEGNEAG